jgi:hypothetical protein
MAQLPFEMLWGVDIAIKKLRPGANFQLEGTNFTSWSCPDNTEPPTWAEVMAQMQADEAAANKWIAENTQNL